ncbi:MOSC domain-containing protein [Crenothrix sp.]|uniref:MOSC domain-containing protein n=1 Tax=Crenothrix sp. TaxID=3100433 RepID=UPI00374CB874
MHGSLLAIYIAPNAKAQTISLEHAELQVGQGIVGDRYYQENGTFSEILKGKADKEVTLIESEQIDRFNTENDFLFSYGYGDFRRNLVTQNVDLNALVGVHFKVGDTELKGIRLCEPCGHLAKILGPEVLLHMMHKAGLRAKVISGGVVSVGDVIEAV